MMLQSLSMIESTSLMSSNGEVKLLLVQGITGGEKLDGVTWELVPVS